MALAVGSLFNKLETRAKLLESSQLQTNLKTWHLQPIFKYTVELNRVSNLIPFLKNKQCYQRQTRKKERFNSLEWIELIIGIYVNGISRFHQSKT